MLLKGLDEVRRAPSPADAVEMVIVRLAYAADLPGPEEALKKLQNGEPLGGGAGSPRGGGGGGGGGASAQLSVRPAPIPTLPNPQSFEEVVALVGQKREIALQMEIERYVRPVSFAPGRLTFEPVAGMPVNLAPKLASRLKEWTGRQWFVIANGEGGGETVIEVNRREKAEERAAVEADPFVKAVLEAFPGAVLGEIRVLAPSVEMPAIPDEAEDED
jgi:DNA polymerase-3 subunit gamma/tau